MFVFLAVPKTGCYSLSEALAGAFPAPNVLAINRPLQQVAATHDLSQISLLRGHFGLLDLINDGLLEGSTAIFSCLREPVARTISSYRYSVAIARGEMNAQSSPQVEEIAGVDFRTFVNELLDEDVQLHFLYGVDRDQAVDLERALRDITELVDVVGITEELERYCVLLGRMYGWNLFPHWQENITPVPRASITVTEEDVAVIRKKCAKDIYAYEYFRRRFHERCAQYAIPAASSELLIRPVIVSHTVGLNVTPQYRPSLIAFGRAFITAGEEAASKADPDRACAYFETALKFLNEAACADAAEDPDLLKLLASGFLGLGRAFTSRSGSAARRHLDSAIAMYARIDAVEQSAGSAEALASLYIEVGRWLLASGERAEAEHYLESAFAAFAGPGIEPTDRDRNGKLAALYVEVGQLLIDHGGLSDGRRYFENALVVHHRMWAADPENIEATRQLAAFHSDFGQLLLKHGEAADARGYFDNALATYASLRAVHPDDVEINRQLASFYSQTGRLLLAHGEADAARPWFENALVVYETMRAAAPRDVALNSQIAASYTETGRYLLQHGAQVEARAYIEGAIGIFDALRTADAHNSESEALRQLASSYAGAGRLLVEHGGEPAQAQSYFANAIVVYDTLQSANPQNMNARQQLATAYTEAGRWLAASGDPDQARIHLDSALAICDSMRADNPGDFALGLQLASLHAEISRFLLRRGERVEAVRYFHSAAAVHEGLLPQNRPAVLAAMSELLLEQAQAEADVGDSGQAAADYQRVLVFLGQLHAADPTSETTLLAHRRAYRGLADAMARLGNQTSETNALRSLIAVLGQLNALAQDPVWHGEIAQAAERIARIAPPQAEAPERIARIEPPQAEAAERIARIEPPQAEAPSQPAGADTLLVSAIRLRARS